jgi:long-chain fatty acid transport protein
MVIRLHRGASCAAMAVFVVAATAARGQAAGFSIFEQGARGMGFAGAFVAVANDPSAIFHNPGGIAFLKGKHLYLGGTLALPSYDFTGADPYPGAGLLETSGYQVTPVPAVYYTHQFSETVVFGVGAFAPFGIRTEWDLADTYSGRFLSQKAWLRSFALNPTVGFKLADRLSVGVGLDVVVAQMDLRRKVPTFNPFTQAVADIARAELTSGWGTGFGFNLGLLAKPSDSWSVGLGYRHKVNLDFSGGSAVFTQVPTGNAQLDALVAGTLPNGATPLTTKITFPSVITGGLAYVTDDWTISAEADRFLWSSFEELPLVFTERPELSQTLSENYTNTWTFRLGIERRLTRAWAVRAGYYRDPSPAPPASISPILPDSDRNGFCLGGSWTNGRIRFDLGTRYVKGSDRSTEGQSRDNYNGTYRASGLAFGASFGYGF